LAAFSSYVLALAPKFRTKKCAKNVDEIDTSFVKFIFFFENFLLKQAVTEHFILFIRMCF